MVMYGPSHSVGAVGYLRRIKNAATVARAVLEVRLLVGILLLLYAKPYLSCQRSRVSRSSGEKRSLLSVHFRMPMILRSTRGVQHYFPMAYHALWQTRRMELTLLLSGPRALAGGLPPFSPSPHTCEEAAMYQIRQFEAPYCAIQLAS